MVCRRRPTATSAGDGAAAAGQVQALSTELAQVKSSHKAEVAAHAATRQELEEANKAIAARKSGLDQALSDHAAELKSLRESAAAELAEVKAASAAEMAEVKQRAANSSKDLTEKMALFTNQLPAIKQTVAVLAKAFKALRKETRDLQGEIEPTAKQCKRNLLRSLAEFETQ